MFNGLKSTLGQAVGSPFSEVPLGRGADDLELAATDGVGEKAPF